jgi:maleylpyruvate isomerase
MEWLEEEHPVPPLLPREPIRRARVRAFALAIACEIAPLSNLISPTIADFTVVAQL